MPVVIAGAHTIIYAEDVQAARAFFRDLLGFPSVDAGEGWLIFALPPGELALHPGPGWGRAVGQHELFFMCHEIEWTVDELKRNGVEFVSPISDEGYGLMTRLKIPGDGEIGLYEPKHPSPLAEFSDE
jgi:catechol 2,3-dioxygenase-like lactoylglutathione lyase family enzyme